MQTSSLIKIVAFVATISAPLVLLAIRAPVEAYGQKPLPDFPSVKTFAQGREGAFDLLGRALIERSVVTRSAIWLKNYALIYGLHHFDEDNIISGLDDWFFYKGDFVYNHALWQAGKLPCLTATELARPLAQLDAMLDVAEASGLEMFISVSPDKSTLFPEKLDPRFYNYWRCKAADAALLRGVMKAEAPRIIDHAEPLFAAKAAGSPGKLYYHTDTHWAPYGAALALRQLLRAVYPEARDVPPPRVTGRLDERSTDIRNLLLLMTEKEVVEELDMDNEASLSKLSNLDQHASTLLLTDSFYLHVYGLKLPFRGAQIFHYHWDSDKYPPLIADAGRVIINVVERYVPGEAEFGTLSWASPLGIALLKRNATAAERCTSFLQPNSNGPAEEVRSPRLNNTPETETGLSASDSDPAVTVRVPDTSGLSACLKLEIAAERPVAIKVFLPRKTPEREGDEFEPGRFFLQSLSAGTSIVTYVLPAYTAGRNIKIVPSGDGAVGSWVNRIEFGSAP